MSVLAVSNIKKRYGETEAVRGISFSVAAGEIVGLLDPNGAGKTTIISMILSILEPSEGSIRIGTFDVQRNRTSALSVTNFAAVYAQLPGNLTVFQNLNVFGRIYEVADLPTRIAEVMAELDLTRFKHTKAGVLSSGEQTRVALAYAYFLRVCRRAIRTGLIARYSAETVS